MNLENGADEEEGDEQPVEGEESSTTSFTAHTRKTLHAVQALVKVSFCPRNSLCNIFTSTTVGLLVI